VLTPVQPGEDLRDVIVSEPLVPYPGTLASMSDEGAAEDRRDVLCFTSDPFEATFSIAGMPLVRVTASADTPSFDVIASLVRVTAAGDVHRLATGATRVVADADERIDVEVPLAPIAWTFGVAEAVRLDITASRFPALSRNLQCDPATVEPGYGDAIVATIVVDRVVLELSSPDIAATRSTAPPGS
jgi:hypothetical protein